MIENSGMLNYYHSLDAAALALSDNPMAFYDDEVKREVCLEYGIDFDSLLESDLLELEKLISVYARR